MVILRISFGGGCVGVLKNGGVWVIKCVGSFCLKNCGSVLLIYV